MMKHAAELNPKIFARNSHDYACVLLNDFACTNTMLFVCYDLNFV
jgi:hypothetical protein